MATSGKRILFRADGNAHIGLGHIHRCLALAEILRGAFECAFAIRSPLPGICKLLASYKFTLIELPPDDNMEMEALTLASSDFDFIVLDGYAFNTVYQQHIVNVGKKLICLDDNQLYHFVAHAVINPAGNILPEMYSAENYTRLFLGADYCIVKKVFREMALQRTDALRREDAVFVCIGGADTARNDTLGILKACETMGQSKWHYYVVLGEAFPFTRSIKDFAAHSELDITLMSALLPEQVAHYMSKCKAAICPPSGLAYEYMHVGGILYLFQVADNQSNTMLDLVNRKLAFSFAEFPVNESESINKVLDNQRKYFDGYSDKRILKIFSEL